MNYYGLIGRRDDINININKDDYIIVKTKESKVRK